MPETEDYLNKVGNLQEALDQVHPPLSNTQRKGITTAFKRVARHFEEEGELSEEAFRPVIGETDNNVTHVSHRGWGVN